MKRTLCIGLCAALLLSLWGCAKTPETSESPDLNVVLSNEDPMSFSEGNESSGDSADTGLFEDNRAYESDGKTVMTSRIQYETYTSEEATDAVKTAINTKITERVQNLRAGADEMSKQAASDNTAGTLTDTYYANYTLLRVFDTPDYGVYTVEEQVYLGGMHPSETRSAMNFSLQDGELIAFGDLFSQDSTVYIPRLISEVKKQIEARIAAVSEDERIFYDNYADGLESSVFDDHWYLSAEGLCLIYEPYELAPYTAGVLTFIIPYENIADLLKDKKLI